MTKFIELTPNVFVAGQLSAEDFERAAAMGFRTVICNRPDHEEDVTVPSREAEVRAKAAGMVFHNVPIAGFEVTDEDNVDAVASAFEASTAPVLMYCRTGTRCALLWAQIAVAELGVAKVEEITANAGYDISIIEDELIERAGLDVRHADACEAAVATF